MKNIVIFDDYSEKDLKPPALLREYVELTERDVREMLVPAAALRVPCPACLSPDVASTFEKFGLTYAECASCGTLYVTPRPCDSGLDRYDRESSARRFWREELAPGSGAARREKIVKPRGEWVVDSTREHLPGAKLCADIGTAQSTYIDEIAAEGLFDRVVRDALFERADVVTLFEVADRTSDVDALFARARAMLGERGLAFVTAILVSGFDLQMLWDRADNIFPPDRLNVFSVDGLKTLTARHGFEPIEFSTPGILDVEIVAAALERDPSLPVPRWARYLLSREEHTRRDFQRFLQSELLSSYGRVVLTTV
ncbi:MAG: methyltransferase domain-containing protein [Coriobacteriia bacterium]